MASDLRSSVLRHPLLLWIGWLVGPAAWALHLLVSYWLVPKACEAEATWMLHATTLATLLMSIAGGAIAWRQWSRAGRRWPDASDGEISRIRFMAVMGMLLCALSALLIIAEGVPNFILSPCL